MQVHIVGRGQLLFRSIEVHDHIIVGKDGHASLKGLRLI
ncbi:UNVERIFIED_ORG: DNA repair protein RadC [Xanthobacter viscosus]|jgi:DNA repair protein RadC